MISKRDKDVLEGKKPKRTGPSLELNDEIESLLEGSEGRYIIISDKFARLILGKLEELREMINDKSPQPKDEWLPEEEARKIIPRGRTWFFKMRKSGYLTSTTIEEQPLYLKKSLLDYLEKNRKDAYR